jgi:hypothetical protein
MVYHSGCKSSLVAAGTVLSTQRDAEHAWVEGRQRNLTISFVAKIKQMPGISLQMNVEDERQACP